MKIKSSLLFLLLFLTFCLSAQKKSLDFSIYDSWKSLSKTQISDNGNFVLYQINPYKGDGKLFLYEHRNKSTKSFERGENAAFSPNSDFIVYKIAPQTNTLRHLKLKKIKSEKLPKDSLGIYVFNTKQNFKIADINSYKTAQEKSSWIAYSYKKNDNDTLKAKQKNKIFDKSAPKSFNFDIFNPIINKKYSFTNVSDYNISRNGNLISFVKLQNDTLLKSTVYFFNTVNQKLDSLEYFDGLVQKLCCNNQGSAFTFIFSPDTVKTKVYELYYYANNKLQIIVDTFCKEIPENWTVSENGNIFFSRDDSKLYFGTALKPEPETKDTLLDEEKVNVDIWHWNDDYIQAQQLVQLKKDKKESFLAVYHCQSGKVVQLADKKFKEVEPVNKGNTNIMLAYVKQPYAKMLTWDGAEYMDVYTINSLTGSKTEILKAASDFIILSPAAKYIVYYMNTDSCWYSYNIESKKHIALTKSIQIPFADEEHDYPSLPGSYSIVGFTPDEKYVWIYDRYDIWQCELDGNLKPLNITKDGRINKISYRYIKTDPENEYIDLNFSLLSAFDKKSKDAGFYKLDKGKILKKIFIDKNTYFDIKKAKYGNNLIFRKENIKTYGDIVITDIDFKKFYKISDANPQQSNYIWANSELVTWALPNGQTEEGLLYKPENFDPEKKYPLLVYFYRLSSDELNRHRIPSPSRSIINPVFYASNNYLVFVPNVRYKTGHPGKSALEYVLSGTREICKRAYVDSLHVGLQGQSWGGYQIAYIITQTNFFKAAAAGAPVSNMFSAYGGIRWHSGMSRAFQYETGQSRIGATPWEAPELYIENSPVFHAPKINTPLFIMHNDNDGAVPWYQGIELYIALRRMEKPVWLINYNGQPHNLAADTPARKDLSIRLMQFFDTFLKQKTAPIWIKSGIPACEKGKTYGYEIE